MPKVYKCSSLLKYQRQTVNPTVMSPDDIRTRTRDVVDTISQEIMSRSSLEGIIKEFNLYTEMRQKCSHGGCGRYHA
jgi:polysaccharide biosynthesis transport protein